MVAEIATRPSGSPMNIETLNNSQSQSHHSHHNDMDDANITSLSSPNACHFTNGKYTHLF
jgi:hypothetical protein